MRILFWAIICVTAVQAEEKNVQKYKLESLDSNLNFSHLKSKFDVIDQESYRKVRATLPSREVRTFHFKTSGLANAIESWDEFDKDLIYLRAKKLPFANFLKKYPNIEQKDFLEAFYYSVRENE